jgi:hypothetical protein
MKAYIKDGKKYVPYVLPWDDMPIDISHVFEHEKPAGKHGFMTVQGNRFVFQDGTEMKFWGTNFNSGANFPPHEYSRKVAKRLAKTGINIVRFHQLDAEWSTPNIFQFAKGKFSNNTRSLDPESLDRLDYLIYCLKEEGIYIYLDLLTYRRFKSGDGIYGSKELGDAGKPYSNFDRTMIELQKEFCDQIWNHYNPYTKLAYKDEPTIVLCEITNENDLFHHERFPIVLEPYRSNLEKRYRRWAEEKGIKLSEGKINFEEMDSNILAFKREVQEAYYLELTEHMRSIGVKIPITGTNWAINPNLLSTQLITDFVDSHAYWWFGDQRKFESRIMTGSKTTIVDKLTFSRVLDKPYFVSEWDEPWPNKWRAECTLYLAAVGLLQDWAGFTIHTYRYGSNMDEFVTRKIGRDLVIGNSYYRGIFDTYNDPAKYGLFYHAALMMRRGDVKTGNTSVGMKIEDIDNPELGMKSYTEMAAIPLTSEQHKFGTVLPRSQEVQDITINYDEKIVDHDKGEVLSDTGQLFRSWEKQYGWIDTDNTKVVYGMVGKQDEIKLNDLTIKAETEFATIAISTLTKDPINNSQNLLLTAVGLADNAGSKYNEDETALLDSGTGPIECEVIKARISIRTNRKDLKVWSVDDEGFLTGTIPSSYENGVFSFGIGNEFESIYYLIQEQ